MTVRRPRRRPKATLIHPVHANVDTHTRRLMDTWNRTQEWTDSRLIRAALRAYLETQEGEK